MHILNLLSAALTSHVTPADLPTLLAYMVAGVLGAVLAALAFARKRS